MLLQHQLMEKVSIIFRSDVENTQYNLNGLQYNITITIVHNNNFNHNVILPKIKTLSFNSFQRYFSLF